MNDIGKVKKRPALLPPSDIKLSGHVACDPNGAFRRFAILPFTLRKMFRLLLLFFLTGLTFGQAADVPSLNAADRAFTAAKVDTLVGGLFRLGKKLADIGLGCFL